MLHPILRNVPFHDVFRLRFAINLKVYLFDYGVDEGTGPLNWENRLMPEGVWSHYLP